MLAAATLAYCLFVFHAGEQLFRDSDTGWHIRNGEQILARGGVPRTDPYSFSRGGQSWFAWEWGADVLMGLAHRAGGLAAVAGLFSLAIFASTWMSFRLHQSAGGDFLLTALLAPVAVTTASLHWLARPHVLSWLFLAGAMLVAERYSARAPERRRWAHLGAVAAASAVWANVHASFLLGPAIALVYAVGHFLRPALWEGDWLSDRRRARWFLWTAAASAAGSLANPYGWRLHARVVSYLADFDLTSRVAEFQSFNFHDREAVQVALAMAVAGAGAVAALAQRKLAQFLLAALLTFAALRSARVLPLVALAVLPLANGAIAEALRGAWGLSAGVQRRLDRVLAYSAGLGALNRRISGAVFSSAAVVALMLAFQGTAASGGAGFPADRFPVAAAGAVERLPAEARLLAPDSFGGYLIYRFDGGRRVYFDGRSDFYGAGFMQEYLTLIQVRPGWREIVRSQGFTHALLPKDSALGAALEQAGWATLYKDGVATLLEAR
jgi:hypothetical protein